MSKYVVVTAYKHPAIPLKVLIDQVNSKQYLVDTEVAHTNKFSAEQEIKDLARQHKVPEKLFMIRKAKGVLTYELGEVVE